MDHMLKESTTARKRGILYHLGLLRWEIVTALTIVGLLVFLGYVMYPEVISQVQKGKTILQQRRFLRTAESLPTRSAKLNGEIAIIDSLLKLSEQQRAFNEPVVIKKMYTLADSAQWTIDKIQIIEPVNIDAGIEIPVLIHGQGTYQAGGKFIDGIENSEYATRIRQLTMKRLERGRVSAFVDLIIMANKLK